MDPKAFQQRNQNDIYVTLFMRKKSTSPSRKHAKAVIGYSEYGLSIELYTRISLKNISCICMRGEGSVDWYSLTLVLVTKAGLGTQLRLNINQLETEKKNENSIRSWSSQTDRRRMTKGSFCHPSAILVRIYYSRDNFSVPTPVTQNSAF